MNIRRQSDVAFNEVGRVNIWLRGGKRTTIWWASCFARTENPKTDQIAKDHCCFLCLTEIVFASTESDTQAFINTCVLVQRLDCAVLSTQYTMQMLGQQKIENMIENRLM